MCVREREQERVVIVRLCVCERVFVCGSVRVGVLICLCAMDRVRVFVYVRVYLLVCVFFNGR